MTATGRAGPIGFLDYLADPFTQKILLELTLQHVYLTAIPVILAVFIGVPLGVLAQRSKIAAPPILTTSSVFLTIPSLALFGLMIPIFGIGNPPVIVALTMYALLPIIRNTQSGLQSVDPAISESARGMGLSNMQRLWRIEMPNAWPIVLTGIRVATLLTVGIAAIAAVIGGDGLGIEIYNNGMRRIGSPGAFDAVLGGTLGILILAALFDGFYRLVGRFTISRGIA